MRRLTVPVAILVFPLLTLGCDRSAPTSAAAHGIRAGVQAGRPDISVNMLDACDAATFNANVGPGTCSRTGGMKFDQFFSELVKHQHVQAWDFAPPALNANVGQTIVATNVGGEIHTLTAVAAFGGGIVPPLNDASGNTTVAPECTTLTPDAFVVPGGTYRQSLTVAGTQKFQCCIHPWMREVVTVSN